MKTALVKLVEDVLRVELRADRMACARTEIEITKVLQGVAVLTYPDGATLARKYCSPMDSEAVVSLLYENGWSVEAAAPVVRWIVTEGNDPNHCGDGELGVAVDGVPYLYYKWPDPQPSPDVKFREIHKREFGEVIRRPSGHRQY